MPGPNAPYTNLSSDQVLQQAFDESKDRLRVDATVTATLGETVIKDGTTNNLLKVNADGSIDSNVVLTAASDSVTSYLKDSSGNALNSTSGALNVNVTSGSSTVTGTVSANINGLNTFQTSQYIIGTTAIKLTPTPLTNRSSISIKAITTGIPVYVGHDNGVTVTNGYPIFNNDVLNMDLTGSNQIWAIASSPGQTLCILEIA
jgi:hypothetical protein